MTPVVGSTIVPYTGWSFFGALATCAGAAPTFSTLEGVGDVGTIAGIAVTSASTTTDLDLMGVILLIVSDIGRKEKPAYRLLFQEAYSVKLSTFQASSNRR